MELHRRRGPGIFTRKAAGLEFSGAHPKGQYGQEEQDR